MTATGHDAPAPPAGADAAHRVLLVDDDRKFARLVAEYLEPFGFAVTAVHTGPEGVAAAVGGEARYAAAILDLMLPGMDGFEVLRRIREKSNLPVLMLTARGEETDRIVGLEIGADDYLAKTASTRELLARLRALLRRTAPRAAEASHSAPATTPPALKLAEFVVGPVRVVPEARKAFVGGVQVTLTPVEFDLLVVLARSAGRVKTRDQLLEECRDREYEVFDRSIDMHISALRKKLGDDPRKPRLIHTIRTVGYMMDPAQHNPADRAGDEGAA